MTDYEALLACYRSGQISERQWQEHLRNREFREWVEARDALAKSEATAVQPVAHAYVVAGECEQIEWGTDVDLPDDPALVWLYPHPALTTGGDDG